MKSLRIRYGASRESSEEHAARRARGLHNRRRRRRITLINKAHELATQCDAHVYVLVRYGGRYYTYKSLETSSWPPPVQDVESSYPLPVQLTKKDMMYSDNTDLPDEQSAQSSDEEISEAESHHSATLPPLPTTWVPPMSISAILNPKLDEQEEHTRTSSRPLSTIVEDYEPDQTSKECNVPCIFVP